MEIDEYKLYEHMTEYGITPISHPKKTGKFYRFCTQGAQKRNNPSGWLTERPDGAVIYGDFRLGNSCFVFYPATSNPYSHGLTDVPMELSITEFLRTLSKEDEEEQARKTAQELAALTAMAVMKHNSPASPLHQYLVSKNVGSYGLRESDDGWLIIPMYDENRQICNVQLIDRDGNKKFLSHGRIQGTYMILGDPEANNKLLMVEGYATGVSAYEQTGIATIIAFNAGNLSPAVKTVRSMYPAKPIIILADNDIESHTGEKEAKHASDKNDMTTYILIPTPGMDANDYINAGGDITELLRSR